MLSLLACASSEASRTFTSLPSSPLKYLLTHPFHSTKAPILIKKQCTSACEHSPLFALTGFIQTLWKHDSMGNGDKESHKLVPRNSAFKSQDSGQECEDYGHIWIECWLGKGGRFSCGTLQDVRWHGKCELSHQLEWSGVLVGIRANSLVGLRGHRRGLIFTLEVINVHLGIIVFNNGMDFLMTTWTAEAPRLNPSLVPKLPDQCIMPNTLPYSKIVPRLTTPIIINSHSSMLLSLSKKWASVPVKLSS